MTSRRVSVYRRSLKREYNIAESSDLFIFKGSNLRIVAFVSLFFKINDDDDDGGGGGGGGYGGVYVDDDEFGVRFPGGTRNSQRYEVLHRLNCNVAAEPLKTLISDLTTRGFYLDTKQYDSLSQVELTMTS